MYIVGWLTLGLIEGFVAGRLAEDQGPSFVVDLVLGGAGALAAGLIFTSFSPGPVTLSLPSIIAALAGAAIVLAIYHALLSRRSF